MATQDDLYFVCECEKDMGQRDRQRERYQLKTGTFKPMLARDLYIACIHSHCFKISFPRFCKHC
jgi:hypothetical protein